jgi:hypothetical protein
MQNDSVIDTQPRAERGALLTRAGTSQIVIKGGRSINKVTTLQTIRKYIITRTALGITKLAYF